MRGVGGKSLQTSTLQGSYFHFALTSACPQRRPGSQPACRNRLLGFSAPLRSVIAQLHPLLPSPCWTAEQSGHANARADLTKQTKAAVLCKCDGWEKNILTVNKKLCLWCPLLWFPCSFDSSSASVYVFCSNQLYAMGSKYPFRWSTLSIPITSISHHILLLWELEGYRFQVTNAYAKVVYEWPFLIMNLFLSTSFYLQLWLSSCKMESRLFQPVSTLILEKYHAGLPAPVSSSH